MRKKKAILEQIKHLEQLRDENLALCNLHAFDMVQGQLAGLKWVLEA